MAITLLTDHVWQTLTAATKARVKPAVAVAYFGQGAAKLLPLPNGSRIVVDASEGAVKSGQTCPAELIKLLKRGVRIYSRKNLHAKIFVFGSKVFVGSANASLHSAHTLREAMLVTTDRNAIAAAREFIRELCIQEIGPETLSRLAKLYRPPRLPGGNRQRPKTKRVNSNDLPRVRLEQLHLEEAPIESKDAEAAGRKIAVKRMRMPRRHELENFWCAGMSPIARGDIVIQVTNEGGGKRMVSPPGTVVNVRKWRNAKRKLAFVYVEVPQRRRTSLAKLAKALGHGWKKRLHREGPMRRDLAHHLLQTWQE
jgi:PLD-like domain